MMNLNQRWFMKLMMAKLAEIAILNKILSCIWRRIRREKVECRLVELINIDELMKFLLNLH